MPDGTDHLGKALDDPVPGGGGPEEGWRVQDAQDPAGEHVPLEAGRKPKDGQNRPRQPGPLPEV